MAITIGEVKIEPFLLERIWNIKIEKEINEHSRLYLKGILKEGEKEKIEYGTKESTQVKVEVRGKKQEILFAGVVEKIEIKQEGGLKEIEVEGVSSSIQLDRKKKSRSFQEKESTYKEIAKQINKEYGADVIDTVSKGEAIGKIRIQYQETDWEFLKRLASQLYAGLVVADTFATPKYFFGLPKGREKEKKKGSCYVARKRLGNYAKEVQNENPNLLEIDSFEYEVEAEEIFAVGDCIEYEEGKFYVSKVEIESKGGVLKNRYLLKTKRGMMQGKRECGKIKGVSLLGTVLEVEREEVKVQLEIDEKQEKERAWKFPYTTPYAGEGKRGWYCMPEIGDTVFIYFPSGKEEEGVGLHSIRTKEGSGMEDPHVKRFQTADGKEIRLDDKEIVISAKEEEIFIQLNEEKGIVIKSTLPITIESDEKVKLGAEEIVIEGKKEILLHCQSSQIEMDGTIVIQGKEVRNN